MKGQQGSNGLMGLPGQPGRQGLQGEKGDSIPEEDGWMFKVSAYTVKPKLTLRLFLNIFYRYFSGR